MSKVLLLFSFLVYIVTMFALRLNSRSSRNTNHHFNLCGGLTRLFARSKKTDVSKIDENSNNGPTISWYPGHIAKAERELADYLKKVDVVIEVRDARIPLATTHPLVPTWVGNKPLIVAIARPDQISKQALVDWREYYALNPAHAGRPDVKVYFVDGKMGAGVMTLRKQALKVGEAINEKRIRRGIQPRAVRAAVIGYPNVGKSALINRLLGRKMAKSRNLPGVTRQLMWVRIGGLEGSQENTIELLDSPGIIPAQQINQLNAIKLAICNDIGEASYDRVVVAAHMCDLVNELARKRGRYVNMRKINERYNFKFNDMTGEEIVYEVAESMYQGNSISAADKLLGDFRRGYFGYGSLEFPTITAAMKNGDPPSHHVSSSNNNNSNKNGLLSTSVPGKDKRSRSSQLSPLQTASQMTPQQLADSTRLVIEGSEDNDYYNNNNDDDDENSNDILIDLDSFNDDNDLLRGNYVDAIGASNSGPLDEDEDEDEVEEKSNPKNKKDTVNSSISGSDDKSPPEGGGELKSGDNNNAKKSSEKMNLDIGRGNYEGW